MNDLSGKTVLLTRSASGCEEWTRVIEDRGGVALSLPCLSIEPITGGSTGLRLRESLDLANWLVLTSRRGIEAVTEPAVTHGQTGQLGSFGRPRRPHQLIDQVRVHQVVAAKETVRGLVEPEDQQPHQGDRDRDPEGSGQGGAGRHE